MAEDFCRRSWPAVEHLLISKLAPGSRVLDLCAGTGQIARGLCRNGFQVTGLDTSLSMLRLASRNAPQAHFFVADARRFSLAIAHDAAICTFNSLAHFHTAEELSRVFASVRAALHHSAPFLFDLTMEEAYLRQWRGSFQLAAEGHTCIVEPAYDPATRLARNHVVFDRDVLVSRCGASDPDEEDVRAHLTITQKCHTHAEISAVLRKSSFSSIVSFDAERDLGIQGDFGRCFFLAA
jgi:SAM-dependent methyltransferase